jgi:hypothetical protein
MASWHGRPIAKTAETRDFRRGHRMARQLQIDQTETRKTQRKGEAAMLKNIVIALGIAALSSTSAFAATKAPKAKTPIVHKVAQGGDAKAKTEKTEKTEKVEKKDKKVKADKKVDKQVEKKVETAPAAAPAPAPATK